MNRYLIVGALVIGLSACGTTAARTTAPVTTATVPVATTVEVPMTIPAPTTTESSITTTAPTPVTAPTTTVAPPTTTATTAGPPIAPPVIPTVSAFTVTHVVDGDTLDLDNGERVRLVGIDTPEQGQCGSAEATMFVASLTLDRTVTLEPSDEDRDKFGRLLRYVLVDGVDVGGQLLAHGYAIPRYNSTDGYGLHPRESEYAEIARPTTVPCTPAAAATPIPTPPAPPVAANVFYKNCDAVRAAGAAPIHPGDPGFQQKFDRDNDGVGCE
jgi:endonuclease YncB( thermonuclease family)